MRDIRIAAVCMKSKPHDVRENLVRMETLVQEASEMEADIVCFPELSLTGYIIKEPSSVYTISDSSEIIDRVCGVAGSKGMIIIAGMVEVREHGKPYLSQIVAGPHGLLGIYRKTHLSPLESEVYQRGQHIDIFRYDDISFGVQLCYEAHFPEISTIMALKGAEIIFMPHASPRGRPKEKMRSWLRHLPARAFDNSVFIVACNQVGRNISGLSFPGCSVVINPSGRPIAKYTGKEEKIIFADLREGLLRDIKSHRMKYFLPNRRPELYQRIIK
ncbi:MAG: nitrilase [Deltaproteobacteria bacterium]|nr:nitrilase [Deltaproteobacteria bacterium]